MTENRLDTKVEIVGTELHVRTGIDLFAELANVVRKERIQYRKATGELPTMIIVDVPGFLFNIPVEFIPLQSNPYLPKGK